MEVENNACVLNAVRLNEREPVIRVLILQVSANYGALWKKIGERDGSATKQAKSIICVCLNRHLQACIYVTSE